MPKSTDDLAALGIAGMAAVLLVVVWLFFVVWVPITMYRECRAHGFSVLYCLSR